MTLTWSAVQVSVAHNTQSSARAGDPLVGRLARASVIAFGTYVGGAGVSYLAQLTVAHAIGAEGYGSYAFAIAWVTILAYLAALGFEVSVMRFVAAYRAQGQWGLLRGVIQYADRRAGLAGATVVGIGLIGLVWFGPRIPDTLRTTLMIGLPLVPLWALVWIRCAVVRALGGVLTALAPDRIVREGFLILLIGTALLVRWPVGAPEAMAATVLSGLIAFGMTSLAMHWWRRASVVPRPAEYDVRSWRRTTLPLLTIAVTETVINRTGVVLLGWFGLVRDAGVYSLASNVALLVLLPRMALNALFAPLVADLFARGDRAGLRALIVRTAWWTLLGAAGVALPLCLIAHPVLQLLGPSFSTGVSALRILLVGQLIASAAGPQLFLLTMTGHERETAFMQSMVALANIALSALFVWQAGLTGAALAATIMQLGLTAGLALLIWRRLRLALGLIALVKLRGRPPVSHRSTSAAVRPSAEVSLTCHRSSTGD
jgi:O-antigen/teichoic acid export membrane protein